MNLSVNTLSFGAKILNTDGAGRVAKMLEIASIYDYPLTNSINYMKLCENINKIFPNDDDIVSFDSVKYEYFLNETYKINGTIIHGGKLKQFGTICHCGDGSFVARKRILNSIKRAAGINNTDSKR